MLSSYWDSVAVFLGINILMGVSLYIPMTAGLISLGQGGFMAIGAYVCAILTKSDVPFFLALVAGGAAAAVAGLVAGAPARHGRRRLPRLRCDRRRHPAPAQERQVQLP